MKPMEQLELLASMLAPGDIPDTRLLTALNDPGLNWQALCWTASQHLVTPALAGSLDRKGLLALLPEEARDYLGAIRTLNRERNRSFYIELVRVAQALNGMGIEPLLLKGAIALLPDQYPGAGDRLLGDLDFVVPRERFEEVYSVIRALGYETAPQPIWGDHSQHHQGLPLLHRELPVTLEPHHRICHQKCDDDALMRALEQRPMMLSGTGSTVRIPDPASRLLHNFLHAQIADRLHIRHTINLRQLLEFVQLRACYEEVLDWQQLHQRLPTRHRRAFGHYLAVAEVLFQQPFPPVIQRPRDTAIELFLWKMGTESPGLTKAFHYRARLAGLLSLQRLSNLPRKFMFPGWLRHKIQSVRAGGPL